MRGPRGGERAETLRGWGLNDTMWGSGAPGGDTGTPWGHTAPPGGCRDPGFGGVTSSPQAAGCSDPTGAGGGGLFPAPPGFGGPMAARGGPVLEPGWLLSPPARPYLDSILHKNQRRVFGEPHSPPE